jgi:hypothetical protein
MGKKPTWKYENRQENKKLTGKCLFPCRFIPGGYSQSVNRQGNYFSRSPALCLISLTVVAHTGKFHFPVLFDYHLLRCNYIWKNSLDTIVIMWETRRMNGGVCIKPNCPRRMAKGYGYHPQ